MLELTAQIILIGSILGMGAILVLKIPVLRNLPIPERKISKEKKISWFLVFGKVKKRVKIFWSSLRKRKFLDFKNFKKYSKEKENKFSDDYWNKIRKG